MEYSLDPADWDELRLLGHRMVDDMMEHLRTVRERPAWVKSPENVLEQLQQPLPQGPQKAADVYEDFLHTVLPYNKNNIHPRFWGWVQGGGTPFGMLADMLASGMNSNVSIGDHSAMYVDRQVLDWSKEMFGFPASASGILTSGASIANITALVVARNHFQAGVKQKGLRTVEGQMMVYGSAETHNCVAKGIEVIGIGSEHFRKVPVDADYRVHTDVLREMIREDRKAGHLPFCIIGNAGTVNTGAIDDLMELAVIAREEGLWYHIDGAFGAIPYILPSFRDKLKGLELADSLSFDFHKWLYMNYEVGCVLIRDAAIHRAAFSTSVNYLMQHERGLSAGPDTFTNYGMELSRGFKALKVWMLLKEHGVQGYARLVRQNLEQAQYLGRLIEESEELELLADVSLNIVCYRWNPGKRQGGQGDDAAMDVVEKTTNEGVTEQGERHEQGRACRSSSDEALGTTFRRNSELNACNKEILMRLHEEGVALPSYTLLNGRYAIRVAITNHRSRLEDFDALADASVRIGRDIHITQ